MRFFKIFIFSLLLLLGGSVVAVSAQGENSSSETCPAVVMAAIEASDSFCQDTGRNQACYGNIQLDAELRDPAAISFEQPGDFADLIDIQTLNLSGYDDLTNVWGVAILRVQANLPDTLPGQNVTFVLFGNVEIDNAAPDLSSLPTTEVVAITGVNFRNIPSRRGVVVGSLPIGESVTANGRLDDGSWLRVRLPTGGHGWLSTEAVDATTDLSTLEVVDAATAAYGPMQAFYFRSGIGNSPCVTAPDSGILVQTPEGVGRVQLSVNGVNVALGSTAFLTSEPGAETKIFLVEGTAYVESNGVRQYVPAGTFTDIPLSDEGQPSGPPDEPKPYDLEQLGSLPLELLEREVELAPPFDPTQVVELPPEETQAAPPSDTQTDPRTDLLTSPIIVAPPPPEGTAVPTAPPPPPPPPCSVESVTLVDLTFVNTLDYDVYLYWVDYQCQEIPYGTIPAFGELFQQTYITHPWRVRDEGGTLLREWFTTGSATVTIP